jgi:hypothetical protein
LAIQGPLFISSRTLKIFFSVAVLGKGGFFREAGGSFPHDIIPVHQPGPNEIAVIARAVPKAIIVIDFNMFTFPVLPLPLLLQSYP